MTGVLTAAGRATVDRWAAARATRLCALGDPPPFDLALAALLGALTVTTTLIHGGDEPTPAVAAALVIGLAQATLLVWRRVRPERVLIALSAIVPIPFLLGLAVSDHLWLVAVYTVFACRPWRAALLPFAAAVAVIPVCAATRTILQGRPWWPHLADWTASLLPLLLAVAVLGLTVGADRSRAAARRAEAEQAHRAEALARHRARIADDLNAVVAVEVRGIAERTEALAARSVDRTEGTDVADRLDDVRQRARDALSTVRLLLERLRGDPRPVTPPLTEPRARRWWRPTRSGLALVGALVVAVLLVSRFPWLLRVPGVPPSELVVDATSGTAMVALAIQLGAFAWWRSAPIPALLVNAAAIMVASTVGPMNYLAATAPVLLYYTAGAGAPLLASAVATAVALGARVGLDVASGAPTGAAYALSVGLAAAVWTVGAVQGRVSRQARRADEARRSEERRVALSDQRSRITRELHDLVGHHLSAVAMQAGVLRRAASSGPLDEEALRHLADSAAAAVDGLPTVTAEASAAPDVERLSASSAERLVAPLRAGGLPVTVDVRSDAGGRSPGEADLFARRILQEALTNVVRHGGSAPTVVEIVDTHDALSVAVDSQAPLTAPTPAPGGGHGLAGMRERVDLLGGHLCTGPGAGGGWSVRAALPRRRGATVVPSRTGIAATRRG